MQVNIMTIVWLLFYLINFNKNKMGICSTRFRTVIMNLNIIVFTIFWIGIIYYVSVDPNELSKYSTWQKTCTVITHFISPLSLFVISFFVMGEERYNYLDFYKRSEVYIVCIYSFLYMIYVYVRGKMYVNDGMVLWAWPYPFLDFQNLFVGKSVIGYMMLLSLVFVLWIIANQMLLILFNNLVHKFKTNKNTIN
ncbi:hypothetical protein [Spiroplasma endosymbiont of Diplazon laetatorius]|uniref:hypothetical protein n=1 Tax=Spiroplasma endosymbiont of Diplazon laetatorius TaxID=3066322 RepID=UPI0030CC7ABB